METNIENQSTQIRADALHTHVLNGLLDIILEARKQVEGEINELETAAHYYAEIEKFCRDTLEESDHAAIISTWHDPLLRMVCAMLITALVETVGNDQVPAYLDAIADACRDRAEMADTFAA